MLTALAIGKFLPLLRRLHIAKTSSYTHTHTHTARNCERETGAYYDIFFRCSLLPAHTHTHTQSDKAMLTGRGVAVVNKRARCPLSLTERCGEGAGGGGAGAVGAQLF